jgi:hypothetical protein
MYLESRINILFEELDKNETGLKVVVRYIVTRTGTETVIDHINNRTSTLPLPPLSFSFTNGRKRFSTGRNEFDVSRDWRNGTGVSRSFSFALHTIVAQRLNGFQ